MTSLTPTTGVTTWVPSTWGLAVSTHGERRAQQLLFLVSAQTWLGSFLFLSVLFRQQDPGLQATCIMISM